MFNKIYYPVKSPAEALPCREKLSDKVSTGLFVFRTLLASFLVSSWSPLFGRHLAILGVGTKGVEGAYLNISFSEHCLDLKEKRNKLSRYDLQRVKLHVRYSCFFLFFTVFQCLLVCFSNGPGTILCVDRYMSRYSQFFVTMWTPVWFCNFLKL